MTLADDADAAGDDLDLPDDAADQEDGSGPLATEAEISCPHCGATMTIALDPGGGRAQEYVEDCQVCCRPWQVRLWYDATGAVDVDVSDPD
jgi:hypothetical protein